MQTQQQIYIKMILDAWHGQNARVDNILATHSDEQLNAAVAPNKNSGIYLIGHLAAVNDAMLPILGFSEKLYPQLENIFLSNPDKSGLEKPTLNQLKKYWNDINSKLKEHLDNTSADDWFTKHNSVSAEDFAKEPHRNKLNIIVNRTIHQSYHVGQLALLKQ